MEANLEGVVPWGFRRVRPSERPAVLTVPVVVPVAVPVVVPVIPVVVLVLLFRWLLNSRRRRCLDQTFVELALFDCQMGQ